ncbi:hypothetical protein RS130_07715 [Paraglaciecola aquimarina]|uniref:Uncharacterized protein n=1 Tax=Paraglaciecola aquimarina TaxID=1235557 RepID=A0ABU3SV21_9ALTE|nr:hypothetical protein [Paraglaciecola aquimarina]MDU0353827.1 hypothetical protein [Paraglaciecola aquimarina]
MSKPIMTIIDGEKSAKVYFDQIGVSIISGIVTIGITHKQFTNYLAKIDQIDGGFITGNSSSERINFIHGGAAMTLSSADFNILKLKHSQYLETITPESLV